MAENDPPVDYMPIYLSYNISQYGSLPSSKKTIFILFTFINQ